MAILVVGSVALDTIETPFGVKRDVLGGSATYFSLAGSFFHPIRIVAVIGEDLSQERLIILKRENIDLNGLEKKEGKTFRWWGRYKDDFNNRETVKLELNVFKDFFPQINYPYNLSSCIFLANIDPALQRNILQQIRKRKIVGSDTIDHWIRYKRDELIFLIRDIDIFFLNDLEARLFSQNSNLYKAAKWIAKKGPKIVVIKKGEHGSLMFYNNRFFLCPGFPVEKVVDPTGAGDAFAGGFMGYLANCKRINEERLRKAIVYGTIMGSFTVESFGPERLLKLKLSDIKKRYFCLKKLFQF